MDFMKENALSLMYIKILRQFLWFIGAWPGDLFGEKLPLFIRWHKYQIVVQTIFILMAEIRYLFVYQKHMTFMSVGHVYITAFLTAITYIRAIFPCLAGYRTIFKTFLMEFHLIHHKHKGSYEKKIFNILEKLSKYFSLYSMAMMVGGMCLFNLLPMYKSYKGGAFRSMNLDNATVEYSVYYYFPGFNCLDHYYISTTLNVYFSYITSCAVCSIDLFLFLVVFQLIGHIVILKYYIENIPKSKNSIKLNSHYFHIANDSKNSVTVDIYDDEENIEIHKILLKIIKYHKYIVRFADDISNFFGPMLACNYVFHLVSGCMLLLECSRPEPETLATFGPLTIIVFGELIQISVTFEIIGYMSEKLINSVYCMPWECMSVNNQKTFRFFLNRVQKPIQLTALGMVPVGVQTMQAILKTTLSYFAVLRSMGE